MERYQWEKDRVRETDSERGTTGGTEKDTGLSLQDLKFHAEYETMSAPPDLADIFEIPAGTPLLRRTYWTSAKTEDAPLSMSRSYLVKSTLEGNPDLLDAGNEPWPGGTHHQLSTVGIEIDRVVDTVTARPPMPDEADILRIESGVSVLALRKVSYGIDGRVVEIADAAYPGDRTELIYDIPLKRWTK
jgi:GntR family transcriptional regulator